MAQLSILNLCTNLSSEINDNKSIKMVTKGGRNVPKPKYFVSRDIETSSLASCLQPVAIIISFFTSYSSSFSMGWCGT